MLAGWLKESSRWNVVETFSSWEKKRRASTNDTRRPVRFDACYHTTTNAAVTTADAVTATDATAKVGE